MPGVAFAMNGADLLQLLPPVPEGQISMPSKWTTVIQHKFLNPQEPLLAHDKARHVGEAVAIVVAETRDQAEDAAEQVVCDFDELPAVVDPEAALRPGSPIVHERYDTNLIGEFSVGRGDVEAAFAGAPHRLKRRFYHHRYAAVPMECRGVVAAYDRRTQSATIWSSTQVVHWVRREAAALLGIPEARVRCIAPDVGGGFGGKGHVYPEDMLITFLAHKLGRPVRWIEDRREHMMSATHSRDQLHDVEVGFDDDGRILALRDDYIVDCGAWNPIGSGVAYNTAVHLTGPVQDREFRGVGPDRRHQQGAERALSRRRPPGSRLRDGAHDRPRGANAWPGAGRDAPPQHDPRRGNAVPRRHALSRRRADRLRQRRLPGRARKGARRGRRGRGVSRAPAPKRGTRVAVSASASAATSRAPGSDRSRAPLSASTRRAKSTSPAALHPQGQGMETIFSQIVADLWKVTPEDVVAALRRYRVDRDRLWHDGEPQHGHRLGGDAPRQRPAARKSVCDRRAISSNARPPISNCARSDGGGVGVVGVPGAKHEPRPGGAGGSPRLGDERPREVEAGLEETCYWQPETVTWSYAVHAAIVEVDPETGRVALDDYAVAHDCGTVVNPMLVEGQIMGGAVQGLGGILCEAIAYDANGQLLSGSLMDYALPAAGDVPAIKIAHQHSPSPLNPLGVKGVGEGGAVAPPAAVANAVCDALAAFGVEVNATPIRPENLVGAMRQSGSP